MKREDFEAFVGFTIEAVIRLAEEKSGHQLQRRVAFRWLGRSHPIVTENVISSIVDRVFVNEEQIYPCVDIGVGDVLEDGTLVIIGSIAGYSPRQFGKNWTGREGPFVHIVGAAFLDKVVGKPTKVPYEGSFSYIIPDMKKLK
jgi:hypothetical protein